MERMDAAAVAAWFTETLKLPQYAAPIKEHEVDGREKQIGGSGGSLEPPGPLLEPPGLGLFLCLHTVYMAYFERLPTRLNPLAERTCFSQVDGSCCSTLPSATTSPSWRSRA